MNKGGIMFLAMITIIVLLPIHDIVSAEDAIYSQQANDDLWSLCKGIQNSHDCAARIEAYQLKKRVVSVSRKGKQLIIALKSGKKITFTDSKDDDTQGKWYSYREYLPAIGYHLIHLQYYEGGGFIFLNANNGKYEIIEDIPLISPDKKRIAVVSYCDAYCNPGIEVLRISDKDIIKEFTLTPKEYWANGTLQWLDKENIKVTIKVPIYGKEIRYSEKHFFIFFADNGWKTKGY